MSKPRIFISATSGDLGSIRQRIKEALRTLQCDPIEQSNFPPDYRSVEEMLRVNIRHCHAVIHIAGLRYGAEPAQRSSEQPRRSYTQMEYHIARELGKPVYTFVCGKDFPYDECDQEDDEKRKLQEQHRSHLLGGTLHFEEVRQKEELDRKVREIRYDKHLLWTTRTLVTLSALVLMLGIGFGYILLSQFRQLLPVESADRLFDARDYAGAFHAYTQLSDRDPGSLQLHRRIEECARLGRLEKQLLDRYLALAQREPANAIFHNYLGNAYLMLDPQDKDGKAREQYESAVRLDPKLSSPLANLGILAYRSGKSDKAESFFKQYVALETNDAQGWVNLGLLYVARVETNTNDAVVVAEADHALRKALQLDPSSSPAYKGLGKLWAAMGRKKEALNAYQRSYALNDAQPDVRQQVELLAWESGGIRADDFQTRGGFSAETNTPAAILAMQLLDKEQFQQAEATCLEWTKLEPDNPLAWRLLVRAYEGQGRFGSARTALIQSRKLLNEGDK